MSVTIYHNPKCGKSRDTLKLIEAKGIHPTVVEYLKTPPTAAELKRILGWLGLSAKEVLRRKEAAENGVDPGLPEDDLVAAMVAHPIVIERPIVVADGRARVGRPPEKVLEIL
ncbi:arsenate reductase (glutaredoxin) [Telmatospirillum siberiense]|uniref:Arsenate reductase n=1 Tax=Telmatospirillum siberiense TaxID=382514 RepID=A0A2N3Q0J6_9PROT|nr:arsenate reductase (glutaredoxin) [Telmatospirillum siberiense]PKU26174.1 arsenate reductase (glutaredoxin) [Telmatospirillum siberiense]